MAWHPRKLWRQLFTEEGGAKLNTAKLWLNVYAFLGAVIIMAVLTAVIIRPENLAAATAMMGAFGFIVAVMHLMAWRAQLDRKAEDLRQSLASSSQGAMQQRSMMGGSPFTRSMVRQVGNRTDDERE